MSRRKLCHCGKPILDGWTHDPRCIICHPEQPSGEWHLACFCGAHVDKRQAYEAVAIYAGIVAMGVWAAQCARSVRVKCPTCRCRRPVWPPPGPCMCCAGQFDLEPEDYP